MGTDVRTTAGVLDALVRLAEKARARPVGIFTIASMEQSLPRLKERMKLNCPIETLVTLEPPKKQQYTF